ncbi:MAG: Asp-tRNA(Asn)/Glu-tRNA(Gln) amidotransferase subunit GatC [Anaerolineales bacterium]|jgi:aspartyl-tRNA(Asn)/glutamyl-tRNA(Gln) amidotransferase subunit C
MSLTIEQVKHIANLARLELTTEELVRYREQISSILAHFEQLQTIDTESIPPTASVSAGENTLRADQSRPGLVLEDLLLNAPDTDESQFRVPPVFE